MQRIFVKVIAAGAVILPAVAYLGYAGMKDGIVQYHVQVDAFVSDASLHKQHVRLAGKVSSEKLIIGQGRLGASFILEGNSRQIPVIYKGVVPDLFKAGCEVIAEGRLYPEGTFN